MLQLDNEVEDDRKEDGRDEGERDVDECEGQSFDERVVHRRHGMPMNNWPLCKQGGDFVHGEESWDEDGAIVMALVVLFSMIALPRLTRK